MCRSQRVSACRSEKVNAAGVALVITCVFLISPAFTDTFLASHPPRRDAVVEGRGGGDS